MIRYKDMLSFESGKEVAIVCGGEYDDQKIYITKEEDEPEREIEDEEDVFEILDEDDFKSSNYKNFCMKDKLKLANALNKHIEPDEEELFEKYADMQNKITERLKKEFELSSGIIIPIPDKESERIYIAGKSGSGKSFLTAIYAREYNEMFPKRKIYIFTKHAKEKAYKNIPHIEITCDDDMVKEEIKVLDFKKSLVIFDDCDHIQDKKISTNIRRFNNDLITTGRKYDIHTITLQHQLMDYKETRNLLNEANKVIFFNSASNYHVTRYLKVYVGLDPQQIKKITGLKSRWTMISLTIPSYVLHEHGIFIL
jgi:hypothetical protein